MFLECSQNTPRVMTLAASKIPLTSYKFHGTVFMGMDADAVIAHCLFAVSKLISPGEFSRTRTSLDSKQKS